MWSATWPVEVHSKHYGHNVQYIQNMKNINYNDGDVISHDLRNVPQYSV